MSYPNASKGLKFVFCGEILEILAMLSTVVLLRFINAPIFPAFTAFSISILALIINLIGLVIAARDNVYFRTAYQITIGLICANLIVFIFQATGLFPETTITSTVTQIFNLMCAVLLLNGIVDLYREKELPTKFVTVTKWIYSITQIFFIGLGIVSSSIMKSGTTVLAIVGILMVIGVVLLLLGYIFYLISIMRASCKLK